jgi:hypothetical protein
MAYLDLRPRDEEPMIDFLLSILGWVGNAIALILLLGLGLFLVIVINDSANDAFKEYFTRRKK